MSDKVTVTKIDDIDGTTKAEATVKFGIDFKEYEIDLSKRNNAKLRALLKPYLAVARKAKRSANRSRKA